MSCGARRDLALESGSLPGRNTQTNMGILVPATRAPGVVPFSNFTLLFTTTQTQTSLP
jgi:hypothetical protein